MSALSCHLKAKGWSYFFNHQVKLLHSVGRVQSHTARRYMGGSCSPSKFYGFKNPPPKKKKKNNKNKTPHTQWKEELVTLQPFQ